MAEETKTPKKIEPKKTPMPEQPPQVRRSNFKEVSLGYTPEIGRAGGRALPSVQEARCA